MKAFNFSQWDLTEHNKGLLFFAQCLEEMLFHYGHDSLKVPALNFNVICIEIYNTIQKIENDILDKGNMKPLFEELEDFFRKDPIANALYGTDFNRLFYFKTADGEYSRNCSELRKDPTTENSINRINKVILYLLEDMSLNDKYFATLKKQIRG